MSFNDYVKVTYYTLLGQIKLLESCTKVTCFFLLSLTMISFASCSNDEM